MEGFPCFKCGNNVKQTGERCGWCGWNGGPALPESDERHVVLLSLLYRIPKEGARVMPYIFRISGSARELAVLEHGDQCELERTKWRITAKVPQKNLFFVKGFRSLEFPNRLFFDFEHNDPVDEIKEEMVKWRSLHSAYEEIWRLKKRNLLRSYLRKPEKKKAVHRSLIQDESPYIG